MSARSSRLPRVLAFGLGGLAVAEVLTALGLAIFLNWTFAETTHAFVTSNSVIGFSFAVCGLLLAWQRPRNVVGWLLIAEALGHATSAFAAPLALVLHDRGAALELQRSAVTVFAWSWPWSIALALPLTLMYFPTGRLPSPRWRWVAVAVVLTAPLFVIETGSSPEAPDSRVPIGYFTIASFDRFQPLWTVAELRTTGALLLALVALVLRYRRGDETERRQLLWLLLATITVIGFVTPWGLIGGTPIAVLFTIPLIPIAITIAMLRHQLLDIRLVVARTLTWLLLSAAVVGAYIALVAGLERVVSGRSGSSVLATIAIALLVSPVRIRLQRIVDRAMYGDRRDPVQAASRLGERLLTGTSTDLAGVAEAVRDTLRLPYAAVNAAGRQLAVSGLRPAVVHSVPLEYGAERVGELVVGLRPGERRPASADQQVLALMAFPLAVAVHATRLSEQLQTSRGRLVTARAEERRRFRRDLHDSVGPLLTGITFSADAATNLVQSDPDRAAELLRSLRNDSQAAIRDIRRLIEDLRPFALDDLGLVAALQERAEHLSWRPDGTAMLVSIESPESLHGLPAAVEAAAYRIAIEAMNNAAKHSQASEVVVRLNRSDVLDIEIADDGKPINGIWKPGVGLQAMQERVAELGGNCVAGPSPVGGRVRVSLPLETP